MGYSDFVVVGVGGNGTPQELQIPTTIPDYDELQ
jgi:hypothetical protein